MVCIKFVYDLVNARLKKLKCNAVTDRTTDIKLYYTKYKRNTIFTELHNPDNFVSYWSERSTIKIEGKTNIIVNN